MTTDIAESAPAEVDTEQHRRLRELLGPYALRHLDAADAADVRAHLAGCPACREDADRFAAVAGDLAEADPAWVEVDPFGPPELRGRVMAAVLGRTGPDRPQGAIVGATAIAVVTLLALGLLALAVGPLRANAEEDLAFAGLEGLEATGSVMDRSWGMELTVEVTGLERGERYVVLLERRGEGPAVSAGTFAGMGSEPVAMTMSGALTRTEAGAVTVATFDGDVVLRADLPGG